MPLNLKKHAGSENCTAANSGTESKGQPFIHLASVPEAALAYHSIGFKPIPTKPSGKAPAMPWKNYDFQPDNVLQDFGSNRGVALRLGYDHGGLVDVDLDTPEARSLAPNFLPETECVFGRLNAPRSHYIFYADETIKTRKYQAVLKGKTVVLMEQRGGENTVIFPPSMHETGEKRRFEEGKGGLPSNADPSELQGRTDQLAAATLLARVWPKTNGIRQDLALALAGGLIKDGIDAKWAKLFITSVADVAGDDEAKKRGDAVIPTAGNIFKGNPVTGWKKLAELLGDDGKEVVDKTRLWLGIAEKKDGLGVSAKSKGTLKTVTADKIKPMMVEWFWPGVIPRGAITMLEGDPGTGKSTICLDLAARQSSGAPLPDGSTSDARDVLVVSQEDSISATVVPRLLAAGADMKRVHLMSETDFQDSGSRPVSIPEDLSLIEDYIREFGIGFMIIEPLVAFLGPKADIYNDQQVRKALSPLKAMADRTGVVVLVVRHLTKKEGVAAMYRGGGSIGIIGAVRSALMVAEDPNDAKTRILASVKSNLGKEPKAWRYQIVGATAPPGSGEQWETAKVEWLGQTDITASSLVSDSKAEKVGAVDAAMVFLKKVLANGKLPSKEVLDLGGQEGHACKTMQRASTELSIKKKPIFVEGKNVWHWSLPQPASDSSVKEEGQD